MISEMEPDVEAVNTPLLNQNNQAAETSNAVVQKRVTGRSKAKVNTNEIGIESLDYEPINSIVHARTEKAPLKRHIYGYRGRTFAKWTITVVVGLLVGFVAYVIASVQELIIDKKKIWTQDNISQGLMKVFFGYSFFGMFLVLMSSCMVLFWAPAAAGGGVTLVMAYLNGCDVPDFLLLKTLTTKIFGTICTISCGLPLGQEGPMVHIGAAIASALTWMHGDFPTKKKKHSSPRCSVPPVSLSFDFYNDRDRREFITAGTAAGLAAAFGAPIGGVLYSFEEASSFWSRKVMWRALICTAISTLMLSWMHERQFSFALPGTLSFHGLQPEFKYKDLPLFAMTSIGAGILGAFVNISHSWLEHYRPAPSRIFSRLLEVCLVTLFSVAVIFFLPYFFGQCIEVPIGDSDDFWFSYTCPQKESSRKIHNDLATLYFSIPHQTIQHLMELGDSSTSPFTVRSLCIHWTSFLLVFVLAYGVATPGGLFMPSMMVGASYGAFIGTLFKYFFPGWKIQPGLHALVGATSMLGGLFRSTVSLVVIIVEGTGGIDFVLPIILAIVVSNWVANHIHQDGAYEADLEHSGNLHFLQGEPPHALISQTAADIMAPDVIGFDEIVTVNEAVNILKTTRHNGFPVHKHSTIEAQEERGTNRGGKMVGLILRHQILWLLEQRAFIEVNSKIWPNSRSLRQSISMKKDIQELQFLEHGMCVYHQEHYPHRRDLSSRPEAVDELQLEDILEPPPAINGDSHEKNLDESHRQPQKIFVLDLRPFMNRAPVTVRAECSGQRVYTIFRSLGLRHLCVTDSNNKVIGMITRKDIALAIKESEFLEQTGSFTRWGSDMQSFYGGSETTDKNKLYNLP